VFRVGPVLQPAVRVEADEGGDLDGGLVLCSGPSIHFCVQSIPQIGGRLQVPSQMLTTDRVQRATVALQMAEFATKVGRQLRQLREERKAHDPRWTQDYTARQVRDDLTGAQYARWERGEVLPREETLERLAEVFGVGVETFYIGQRKTDTPDVVGILNGGSSRELTQLREMVMETLQANTEQLGQLLATVASLETQVQGLGRELRDLREASDG
jgi:transcriptional regulator with XRE-family HTH domain